MLDRRPIQPVLRLDRRRFLQSGALAGLYSLVWAHRAPVPRQETIIVVGAGIAGLAAAADLRSRGFQVLVLEGRDRIGGRIWTNRDLGVPVDLGASWIEGDVGNPITEIADDAGAGYAPTDFDDVALFDYDGTPIDDATLVEIGSGYEDLMAAVYELGEGLDRDVSYLDAIESVLAGERLAPEEERALSWVLSQSSVQGGADMAELSLWYSGADDAFDGESMLFPGGYDQVVRRVADGLDVRTGVRVGGIEHAADGVRLTTTAGTFEGAAAVVTVPLGVLQRGSIEFAPGLPDAKLSAISRLEMGTLNKVVLRFPHSFWPDDVTFLGYMAPPEDAGMFPVFMNWDMYTGVPALMGFTGGDFARSIEGLDDEEVAGIAMQVLRTMFGSSIPDPSGGIRARWNSDPFAFGSYSHIPVGATDEDYDTMAEPVGERLFFAGEATIRRYPATVHGAFLSGIRESERIASLAALET